MLCSRKVTATRRNTVPVWPRAVCIGGGALHQPYSEPYKGITLVKYLGLILGKGLTWKARLKNVMTKVCRDFWTCKGTFGKTWSLKPQILLWMYTMVMKPMLTYGSTVWWPRVVCKVSRMELRLAYQRGNEDGPTAAVEVLLRLSSLHVTTEAEAQGSTL
jgi:hypothetical protein